MTSDADIPVLPEADEPATQAASPAEKTEAARLASTSERSVEAGTLEASMSAIASAKTGRLEATASAVGIASVAGDTSIRLSAAPLVYTKGDATFHQSYASAFIAGNEVSVSQGGSPVAVARTISFEQGGSLVTMASNVSVKRGFVGMLMAGDAEISDDSRVLMTGRSVAILAAALLGGLGLVAVAMAYSASRVSRWRPNISVPGWPGKR